MYIKNTGPQWCLTLWLRLHGSGQCVSMTVHVKLLCYSIFTHLPQMSCFHERLVGQVDVLVFNPPYVVTNEVLLLLCIPCCQGNTHYRHLILIELFDNKTFAGGQPRYWSFLGRWKRWKRSMCMSIVVDRNKCQTSHWLTEIIFRLFHIAFQYETSVIDPSVKCGLCNPYLVNNYSQSAGSTHACSI